MKIWKQLSIGISDLPNSSDPTNCISKESEVDWQIQVGTVPGHLHLARRPWRVAVVHRWQSRLPNLPTVRTHLPEQGTVLLQCDGSSINLIRISLKMRNASGIVGYICFTQDVIEEWFRFFDYVLPADLSKKNLSFRMNSWCTSIFDL